MSSQNVTIKLTHEPSYYAEYKELTVVSVDILVDRRKKVGTISALILNRRRVPARAFYSAFDGHSAELQRSFSASAVR